MMVGLVLICGRGLMLLTVVLVKEGYWREAGFVELRILLLLLL